MNDEPCDNCLILPVCLTKEEYDVVDNCDLLQDHLKQAFADGAMRYFYYHVVSLKKSFSYTIILIFNLDEGKEET
jgi:hypothetical protein